MASSSLKSMLEERATFLNPPGGTRRRRRARTADQRDTEASLRVTTVHRSIGVDLVNIGVLHVCLPVLCGERKMWYVVAVAGEIQLLALHGQGKAARPPTTPFPFPVTCPSHTHISRALPSLGLCLDERGYCSRRFHVQSLGHVFQVPNKALRSKIEVFTNTFANTHIPCTPC